MALMVAPDRERLILVYRVYSPLGLLYVGQTKDLHARLLLHRTKAWWPDEARVYVEGPMPRAEAKALEARLIRELEPLVNGTRQANVLRPLN